MVIAFGSYPKGRKFKSYRHHQYRQWPHGQAVKTPPFHGGIMGSNPVGVTSSEKRLSERKVFFHNDICSDEQVKLLRNDIHFVNDILFEYMVPSKARVHIFCNKINEARVHIFSKRMIGSVKQISYHYE